MLDVTYPGTRISSRAVRTLLLAAFAVGMATIALPAQAQVKRIFDNLSFEQPAITATNPNAGCRLYIPQQLVPGWDTDHPIYQSENSACNPVEGLQNNVEQGRILELWRGPRDNSSGGPVTGRSGAQFIELNAQFFSRVFQTICLVNNEQVGWRFSHRGRTSASVHDVMTMRVGTSLGSSVVTVGTTNNGTFLQPQVAQGTADVSDAATGGWRDYTGAFIYVAPSGNTNIGFEAISTADGGTTMGNFLDDIQMILTPFVDFASTASTTPETSAGNLPAVRVNGTVGSGGMQVRVRILGSSTAVLGEDYEFTSDAVLDNNGDILLTIPAGVHSYDLVGQFPLPIQTINNQDVDDPASRTIIFEIQPASQYLIASSTSCGAAPNDQWTYTIVDDDAAVTVTKGMDSVTPDPNDLTLVTVIYRISVSNSHVNPATYELSDTPDLDPDLSIIAARYKNPEGMTIELTLPNNGSTANWILGDERTLETGGSHVFEVTLEVRIQRNGTTANDACVTGGTGLFNQARARVDDAIFESSACQATPTPIWVTLDKHLQGRAIAGDQARVQIYSGGIALAGATTTPDAMTVSTGTQVYPAGNLIGFSDQIGPNGDFGLSVVQPPDNYHATIQCSNEARVPTGTQLPDGVGSREEQRMFWGQFSTRSGDDISCTITNTPLEADLAITKTNNATAVVSGKEITYQVVVTNNGPATVTGAVVTDTPGERLECLAEGPVTCAGAACPAGPLTIANLKSGVTLGTLPPTANDNTVAFVFTCNVL